MDITEERINVNPRQNANPCSVLFFTYTVDTFKKGYKETLDIEDLYNPVKSDESALLGDRLEANWKHQEEIAKKNQKKLSLLKVLIQTFWREYLNLGVLAIFVYLILSVLQPLMLRELLDYFAPVTSKTKNDALVYAGAIVMCNFLNVVSFHQLMMGSFHLGMKLRVACCSLIYRKVLKLSRVVIGETASGKIINLLSNDVSRFDMAVVYIHYIWIAPIQMLVVFYLLYTEVEFAGFIGLIPVLLLILVQGYSTKLIRKYRLLTADKTDERVSLMNEIIAGIQVIKMYAWEKPFENIIKISRKQEINVIRKSSFLRGIYSSFYFINTRLAMFCTLLTVALTGQAITAAKVYVVTAYVNIFSEVVGTIYVRAVSEVGETLISIKRLQEFMLSEEFEKKITYDYDETMFGNALKLVNLTSTWNPGLEGTALNDLTVTINTGALVGVIGPIGSGKTSLLLTILGELEVSKGRIEVNGSLSYASQDSWIFTATVRQNIVFGDVFDKKRYNEVVRVCCLEKDFKQFSNGDLTIVGERGISLSGGQKARINLARAVYRDVDIYLMDDPLSAVDTHVGKDLYEECINKFLRDKTRILITHQVHHLKNADNIIIMNNGCMEIQGNFKDLACSEHSYAKILRAEQDATKEEMEVQETKDTRRSSIRARTLSLTSLSSDANIIATLLQDEQHYEPVAEIKLSDIQEGSSKGKTGGSTILKYLAASDSFCTIFIFIILVILAQALACGVDYFVSHWVDVEENRTVILLQGYPMIDSMPEPSTDTLLYIYGSLVTMLIIAIIARSLVFIVPAMRSSTNLHNKMFVSVIYTAMRFFETNPSGRILNRFSKDIGTVDDMVPKILLDAIQFVFMVLGAVILVAVVEVYYVAVLVVMLVLFVICQRIFLRTSENIKRLEGITRSPVFTHLNASLQGISTIRACGVEDILAREFDKYQDLHTSAWFMFISANSAFGFWIDITCCIFAAIVTLSLTLTTKNISGGSVGLALTQTLSLAGLVQWSMRQMADCINYLVSVERVREYTLLPPEKQPDHPKTPDKGEWPKHGKLSFDNVSLRYSDDSELALKNLYFTIQPKEKIGIVGRTGAGKTSLISALFRLADIEGDIEIDGIPTRDLTLQGLRSKISVIPQDPVLFSGTLRYNLDPFEEYTDDVLYQAIRDVELKDPANTINRLEANVMDRGANYSVGERQLLCLARAIIRSSKILILDEATANVDPQTDAIIQNTIRSKFAECTVLTIAHRLNTIIDSDRVLVMANGEMVEFSHPHLLLQNRKGAFYGMVAEIEKGMMEELKKVAREHYELKQGVPE